ncbi:long-chain acyl-CoA synthetase [Pseudonocardia sediminis]|uniref:Long-chain acyl-CoA synthetase n=1 Tax=Pseudonocardia sediminis TaxID=1397368 RepID=A0A4Q7V6X7_PSEST|nr:AMP-binding protein [Pseudonocardia sediminis]RZT88543.1 long-chain acyl-CoA synthetase [Pseudonocardia sediminis]
MTSSGPDRPAPVHVADLLTRAAADRPDSDAVVDVTAGTTLTWSALDAAATAEAARLRGAGVRPGDRVVIALPDGAGFCVALFGALRADAVAVPVGPGSVRRELDVIFSQAGPSVVVAEEAETATAEAAAEAGARLLGPPDPDAAPGGPAPEHTPEEWGGEALAVLVFTSGTTGRPRGVQLSHRALLANREQTAALRPAPVTPNDRVLLALPLFHVYGMAAGLLQVCWAGATVVLPGRFDPARTAEVLVSTRVSVVAGVPSMFRALLDVPAPQLREAFGGVRLCTSGGAPLPAAWLTAFREATGLSLHEGYGLSEGGPVITTNDLGRPPKAGAVGRALPGVEMRLVDSDGAPLVTDEPEPDDPEELIDDGSDPTDDTGLIALRGPNLFSGYWPDGHGGPDADGWFRTADVGYLDADGDLHLVDRSSDLVIVNGFNVYPREVEQVVGELDAVAEVAVVGVPDDRTGAAVKAVVVAAPGSGLTEEQVREHCAVRLARFKRPAVVTFAEELPRTPTGKIARRTLAQL